MPDEIHAAQNLDSEEHEQDTQDNPKGFGPIEKSNYSVLC